MDNELILATLKKLKEISPKRNFKQSIDLIINLKNFDLKKTESQVNLFVTLPHDTGKKVSIGAFVDTDMEDKAKAACDEVIPLSQFERFKGKAEIKKLAAKHDFFIAQASIMPKVAASFGRFLGPRGKMPNPKVGCVVAPNANLSQLCERLRKTIILVTKNEPTIKCKVGKEDANDNDAADNIMSVYNNVIQKIPNEKQGVKSVMVKLTMGPAIVVGKTAEEKDTIQKAKRKGRAQIKLNKASAQPQPGAEKETPEKSEGAKEAKKEPKKDLSHVKGADEPKKKSAVKDKSKENKKQSK